MQWHSAGQFCITYLLSEFCASNSWRDCASACLRNAYLMLSCMSVKINLKCGTSPRQLPPLLTLIPSRPNISLYWRSSPNDCSRISFNLMTSPLRNEMSMLSWTGCVCTNHSIFCDLGQFKGRGVGMNMSLAKSKLSGRIPVLGNIHHGSESRENNGSLLVSDTDSPRHKR